MALDTTSYLLGKKSGGGGGSNYQSKSVEITENGTTNIRPDTGYDALSNVNVSVSGILDTSDADAIASDMAIGKTAYVDGNKITGNVPVGSSSVATNYASTDVDIYLDDLQVDTQQGNTNQMFRAGDKISVYTPLSDVAPVIGASAEKIKKDEVICGITGTYEGGGQPASVPSKDVDFYDYDGTRVYSYTRAEIQELEELPANPSHDGLTAQGWSSTLQEIKDHIQIYKYDKFIVSQYYITDDGDTRIYITLDGNKLSPYLGLLINGTVQVDWGDGNTENITNNSVYNVKTTGHTYSTSGDYVIKIKKINGSYYLPNGNSSWGSQLIYDNISNNLLYYNAVVNKIEIGNVNTDRTSTYVFYNMNNLKTISIPKNLTLGASSFANTYKLNFISKTSPISTSVYQNSNAYYIVAGGDLYGSQFSNCRNLKGVAISNSATTIPDYCFSNSLGLSSISIPRTVATIGQGAFNNCKGLSYVDFSNHTSIPTLNNSNAFTGVTMDCKIIVPDDLYENWIVETNWTSVANKIVKASEVE